MSKKYGKWIPVEERLPDDPEVEVSNLIEIEANLDLLEEHIVTLENAEVATMYYIGNGEWWDVITQQIYWPLAWMQMPEAYVSVKR